MYYAPEQVPRKEHIVLGDPLLSGERPEEHGCKHEAMLWPLAPSSFIHTSTREPIRSIGLH